MTARDLILARVREALSARRATQAAPPARSDIARALPIVGEAYDEHVRAFAGNAALLRAGFHMVADLTAAAALVARLADEHGWTRVASHQGALTTAVAGSLARDILWTDGGYSRSDLASCHASITGCIALAAQTGSVLVAADTCGGRTLSVLPPHHVVLATRSQLVAGLLDAFALARASYGPNLPAFLSFITGPSRTADIERILVLGAHGPAKLDIVLIEREPAPAD